jgi:hypothetical protein
VSSTSNKRRRVSEEGKIDTSKKITTTLSLGQNSTHSFYLFFFFLTFLDGLSVNVKIEPVGDLCDIPSDPCVKQQPYDFLSDERLHYFYLGLLAASVLIYEKHASPPIYFHPLSLPFLHRLVKRYYDQTISLR